MRENADQSNSEYGHFLSREWYFSFLVVSFYCTVLEQVLMHVIFSDFIIDFM